MNVRYMDLTFLTFSIAGVLSGVGNTTRPSRTDKAADILKSSILITNGNNPYTLHSMLSYRSAGCRMTSATGLQEPDGSMWASSSYTASRVGKAQRL